MASSDPEFAQYCCELLASAGPCRARRMFGGWGISVEDLSIAILADLGEGDTLWLKAGPISNQLFDIPQASAVLNDAHGDVVRALAHNDSAAVRRAIEKDIFVAGQFLRQHYRQK